MPDLERYQAPQISELSQWAETLYESGTFTDVKSTAQAFVKIAAGAELGLSPFQSMTGVHFIQGKPVVGSGLLASLIDKAPYNYTTTWEPSLENPESCTITVFKHGVERGKARFSLADAKRAGLTGANWQKYPDDMLFARAVSKAVRRYAPGATGTVFYVTAHGESEIQPDSRVTAEVITDAEVEEFDPATEPAPPVVKPPGPPSEPVEGDTSTKGLLGSMSAFDKGDLYKRVALEKGARLATVKSALCGAYLDLDWIDVGEPCPDEPDPVAVLEEFRRLDREAAPSDAVEAFDRFAKTGEDLDAGDQATLDAEAHA